MTTEEEYILQWNDHKYNFFSLAADDLFRSEELTDVTVCCGDQLFDAHRLILSVCSPYFRSMLARAKNHHPIVFLKDVKASDFERLLHFMYYGEVRIPNGDLESLIMTAKSLRIKGLANSTHDALLSEHNHLRHRQQQQQQVQEQQQQEQTKPQNYSTTSGRGKEGSSPSPTSSKVSSKKEVTQNPTPPKKRKLSSSTMNNHHHHHHHHSNESGEDLSKSKIIEPKSTKGVEIEEEEGDENHENIDNKPRNFSNKSPTIPSPRPLSQTSSSVALVERIVRHTSSSRLATDLSSRSNNRGIAVHHIKSWIELPIGGIS